MATDYLTSVSAFQPQRQQHHHYQQQQSYNPLYSTSPIQLPSRFPNCQSNSQLTSPTFNNQPTVSPAQRIASQIPTFPNTQPISSLPGIRQQSRKAPLYVPAVLRRTEAPLRQQQQQQKSQRQQQVQQHNAASSISAQADFSQLQSHARNMSSATNVSQSTLSRLVSDEWNDETLGDVTGPPSRNHWKV